jgi:serpin B
MTLTFAESDPDFSGMLEIAPRLYVSYLLHKSYVAMDEQGTEAAAPTAIEVVVGEEPFVPMTMCVDRPILFLIRDSHRATILFSGSR